MKTRLAGTVARIFCRRCVAIRGARLRPFVKPSRRWSPSSTARTRRRSAAKPYVVLVSFDGYRYDYPKLYGATHLEAMAARGASAPEGMIPSYPSITFPNHYTIVTGLYPEHHGIVANRILRSAAQAALRLQRSRKRIWTGVGMAAFRCGRSRKSRACAARVFSGRARKRKSPASGPRTICISTTIFRMTHEWSK